MTKEVTLRQAGGLVSATLPKDVADRLRLEPGDRVLAASAITSGSLVVSEAAVARPPCDCCSSGLFGHAIHH